MNYYPSTSCLRTIVFFIRRGSCKGLHVNVKCSKAASTSSAPVPAALLRNRRFASTTSNGEDEPDVYVVEVAFPANRDPVVSAAGSDKDEIQKIIERAIYETNMFDVKVS